MVVESTVLDISLKAARLYGLPDDRVVLFDSPRHTPEPQSARETVSSLIKKGLNEPCSFVEPIFRAGEGKTRVALLAWSSGTTGPPKVGEGFRLLHRAEANHIVNQAVSISHYALIANIIQMALHNKVNWNSNSCGSLFRPGNIALGGSSGSLLLSLFDPDNRSSVTILSYVFLPISLGFGSFIRGSQTSQALSSLFVTFLHLVYRL